MSHITIRRAVGQLALGVTVLLLLVPTAFATTITNGSFEAVTVPPGEFNYNLADIPGWTHTGAVGDGVIWHNGPVCCGGTGTGIAGSGLQWVTLGGGFTSSGSSAWSQTLTGLVIGKSYTVTFMLAAESFFAPTQSLTAGITSGSLTPSQTFVTPVTNTAFWQNWGTAHYIFVPTATSATLQFSVTNQQFDVGLDAVSIAAATPEPGSLVLLGTGLLGILGAARRKLLR